MKYIEAPNVEYIEPPLFYQSGSVRGLFLGGGISNCPDWQSQMVELLSNTDLTLFNPRRKDFDVSNKDLSKEQIKWEFKYLKMCVGVMFWFCKETLCPITLFEYGKMLAYAKYTQSNRRIFVGCDPEYQRIEDVRIQTELESPHITIHTSLNDVANEIINWEKEEKKKIS